jgi:hypothetical protein
MASVFNEYALKSQFDTSVHLQVFFLCILSCPQAFWAALWIIRHAFVLFFCPLCSSGYVRCQGWNFFVFQSILRMFAWIILQNLFLYGYGALFNFLAILCTAIYQGMVASLLFFVSWFLCALWGLSPHLGHCDLKVSCANMALLSNNPTLDLSFNVLISCYALSEYGWVIQGQEQEEMGSILWKGTQRPPCVWSSIMQLRVSFPHFSSNMQVSLLCLTTSALVIPCSSWGSQIPTACTRHCHSSKAFT